MEARPVPHPSADSLRAFGLGQMDDTAAQALMGHLDDCPECRRAVAAQSGDDFLARFRQAHGRSGTPAPARSLAEVGNPAAPTGGTLPTCHTPVANVPPQLAGHPDYEVLRELGRGGMGVVYLARNKPMDRLEVLKVVNKTLLEHPGAIERFQREIRSAAKLSHANIVTAYSVLQQGDLLAFAMEYIAGQDLAALVKARGPLPIPYACYYVQQAAFGLQHAFEKGMVHRNIKPQNLMLARDGPRHILKVLDFGLAKATREQGDKTDLTGEGRMLGTPDFMAPEQTVDAARADIRADIYSLGCTLYYLLSGGPPFSGKTLYAILQAHHSVEARALNQVRAEVPEGLAAVVRKMMAKEPAQRYQRPIEVVQALAPFVRQSPKSAPPPLPPSLSAGAAGQVERPSAVPQAPSLPWDTLATRESTSREARKSGAARTPQSSAAWRKGWLGGGLGVGLLLLALLVLWASGVFKVKTKDGTIVLENVPDGAEVLVDGATVQVKAGDGKIITITIPPGKKHWLEVKKEGFKVFGEAVEIDAGERRPIRVSLKPESAASKPPPLGPDRLAEDKGFVPLFNGKDLTGWIVDGRDTQKWTVEDGAIAVTGSGWQNSTWLLSDKDYTDFICRFEYRLGKGGLSQVALRAKPGEKPGTHPRPWHFSIILKDAESTLTPLKGHPIGGLLAIETGSFLLPPQWPAAVNPPDSWNRMEVEMRGQKLRVWINGRAIHDTDLDRLIAMGSKLPGLKRAMGRIGFMKHTGNAWFRKIEIKELSPTAPRGDGFVPLFNGKDLAGWKVYHRGKDDWEVQGGLLTHRGETSHLFTERENYENFHLRVEARLNKGGNSGILFRVPFFPPTTRFRGFETDITLDGRPPWTGTLIEHGPVVLRHVRVQNNLIKPGQWFTLEVRVVGLHVEEWIGGKKVVDYLLPEDSGKEGAIALQHLGAKTNIEFRKVELRELETVPSALPPVSERPVEAFFRDELLRNPGCEEPALNGMIPGWVLVKGVWAPQRNKNPHDGNCIFYPTSSPVGELRQDVDLRKIGTLIDKQDVTLDFRGYVRSAVQAARDIDSSQIVIEYRDNDNRAVLATFDSKRHRSTEWKLITEQRLIPRNTRWVRVRLISIRYGRVTTSNDGFYDSLSLKLQRRK